MTEIGLVKLGRQGHKTHVAELTYETVEKHGKPYRKVVGARVYCPVKNRGPFGSNSAITPVEGSPRDATCERCKHQAFRATA